MPATVPLKIRPPLKWAGGKRWQVPHLRPLWEPERHRRLVEPFCGGLAVALGLMPERAVLNDANPHLINFYRWLQRGLRVKVPMENDETLFYQHRDRFNALLAAGKGETSEAALLFYYLNRTGYNGILCVDTDLSAHRYANLKPLRYGAYLCHDEFLAAMARGAYKGRLAAVVHLGACSSTTETNWDYLRENNLEYSKTLCKAAVDSGARFVQASSAATYGDGEQGYSDDHAGLDALKPLNLYARSKHEFDLWARDEGFLDRIAVLKYFNVYGPNEWHKEDMRSMVCKGYEQIRDTGRVKLFKSERPDFADGGQRRDFLYVKDAVAMTLWLLDHPEHNGIFNIGTGVSTDWNRLMGAIFAAMDRPPAIEYIDMPPHIAKAYQYDTRADITKLLATGYTTPVTGLEDAVRDYVVNYLATNKHLEA